MTRKSRKNPPIPPCSPPPPSVDSDKNSLDEFCKNIHLDEISLESWEHSHANLDLRVPLWLSADLARVGGERPVKFSRNVPRDPAGKGGREPASLQIFIPAEAREGQEVRVSGAGDRSAAGSGDLIVIVRITK